MEALAIAICSIIESGDEVIIFNPGYPSYIEQILFAGGKPVPVPLLEDKGWKPDMEKLREVVNKKTKAIIICNPSNPTGAVWDQDDLDTIVACAEEYNLILITDQTYEFLVYDGKTVPSFLAYTSIKDQLIICSGFSKEYAMTGWRVGYLYAPAKILEQALKIHDSFVICAPTISQYAALIALTQKPKNQEEDIRADLESKRDIVCERLDRLGDLFSYRKPEGAYYILARYKKTKLNSWDFAIKLLNEAKVIGIPGSAFGSLGEGCIRFSYGTSIENIHTAFDRIEEWNKGLK
jgi:aminotransferase